MFLTDNFLESLPVYQQLNSLLNPFPDSNIINIEYQLIYTRYANECNQMVSKIRYEFQMGALLAWPLVARDGKRIYLAMKIY